MYIPKTGAALATVAGLTLSCLLAACAVDRRNEVTDHVPPPLALEGTAYETALQIELAETSAREDSGLYNVFTLSDSIVSGSEPEGEEAFRVLQSMGINTIVSVDGKVPNEDLATSLGMTYVHVPIHYSGISEDELTRLAKTFREKDGPFYVHCFHGKHRGPAAAAVGRLVVDGIPREQALAEMHLCGTSSSYEGLYLSIAEGHIAEREATDDYEWDFPAAHPFGGFRQAMVEISRVDDSLEYLSLNGWEPSDNHPDLDAVNEATRLASALLRSSELDDVADKPADFHSWMGDAVKASTELRDALEAWTRGSGSAALAGTDSGVGIDDVDRAFDALSQSCKACHEAYRND
jgi:hypothetical protein